MSPLLALQPDAIFAVTTPAVAALLGETRTVPIVFARVADAVGSGFVSSLAKPNGNVTGFINFEPSIAYQRLRSLLSSTERSCSQLTVLQAAYSR